MPLIEKEKKTVNYYGQVDELKHYISYLGVKYVYVN